ncbi:hypothetical protein N7462_011121 [Penicillium macrosclerotiorum]|uniref:uncharacterized protein n=1 Tax=Penicillium macrosclerotiorum TaxID=303699 RepID=UPI00254801BA|nr:uncharacterized protein N7462_011121 [Penicillium macrosclerotiorum]KAJ5666712.1 hypothetical protein N7462_011121 [Penicillium macrosclerotiorum]
MASQTPLGEQPAPMPADDYAQPSRSKGRFRFKSSSSRDGKRSHRRHESPSRERKRHHSSRRHRSPRSSKRRHKQRASPSPDPHAPPTLDPEAAFRESLFDAMCDDEGAAYWESVYGQPIHTYAVPGVPKGPDGELEQMSDEEYAAYVRARMWERTREGMQEEQERLRAERRKAKAREDTHNARERERLGFERAMEESLRRGAERKSRKKLESAWTQYLARWEEIATRAQGSGGPGKEDAPAASTPLRNLLFWPVESGKRKDVTPDSVREFMRHAPAAAGLLATLKVERVRWHPDKIQHRYSGLGIDEVVMRSVTEVFQIVDRMWNEERERAG